MARLQYEESASREDLLGAEETQVNIQAQEAVELPPVS